MYPLHVTGEVLIPCAASTKPNLLLPRLLADTILLRSGYV
jgi:hypothetical protein